ncbi:MAG: VolA/Pla-1 family phospholipase [Thalassotalea sp.]
MNKLFSHFKSNLLNGVLISSALLALPGCDNETLAEVKKSVAEQGSGVVLKSRITFDPSGGKLSIPNDLLFSDTTDGTLNLDNIVDDITDFSDPQVAISALDGWSTINPFSLAVDLPANVTLAAETVSMAGSVQIFEVLMGGPTASGDCATLPSGIACQLVSELTFQQDFTAFARGANIAIVPLKPLKAKTTYVVILTEQITDSNGNAVEGSFTYNLVKQDINQNPLGSASQLKLQAVINSFETVAASAGVNKQEIIYSMALTTQSTLDVATTIKKLMAAPIAVGGTPTPIIVNDAHVTVAQVFQASGITLSPELDALYSSASLYQGSVTLPYYLGIPTSTNIQAPVNDWWKALCDSGVMLASIADLPEGPLTASDQACMAVGLRDLSSVMSLDVERNLTKFNPVPAPRPASDIPYISHPGDLEVQMTVPNISLVTDQVRASYGLSALTQVPENGWPVVILQHGITSKKEDMLALTGILSAFGFATVAIDHPLHGSRGFDLDNDGTDDINASSVSATHYMNLANLLTTRDNVRQSSVDTLGLRLSLNAVVGAPINGQEVSFVGHSLGGLTGINTIALTNTELAPGVDASDALDALFTIKQSALVVPGIGIANFLMASPSFSDLIKANLTLSLSTDFQALIATLYSDGNYSEGEFIQAYHQFLSLLNTEQTAKLNSDFAAFTFAAQTVTDAGDPVNYVASLAAAQTPTLLIEVVGDGEESLSDQVIPNNVSTTPLAGTEPAIALLGLPSVSETSAGSGVVRFTKGHHGSLLSPSTRNGSPDPVFSARATQEMQAQVATFLLSQGQQITITDTELVQ